MFVSGKEGNANESMMEFPKVHFKALGFWVDSKLKLSWHFQAHAYLEAF